MSENMRILLRLRYLQVKHFFLYPTEWAPIQWMRWNIVEPVWVYLYDNNWVSATPITRIDLRF